MSTFKESVVKVFRGAMETFRTFPAANACALAFALVTMVRIQLEWPQQEAWNFLFNCLHLGFAAGALFSLAAITGVRSRLGDQRSFWIANVAGVLVAGLTVVLLYFFGGYTPDYVTGPIMRITQIAGARVSVLMFTSVIAFIYLAGYPEEQSDFSKALFMTQKALFIALFYGGVIMAGTSGVAGAVQALLYRNMSEKVYMYLATITGFLAFTIYAGYFPDFTRERVDEHREVAQAHPRFIQVLFQHIMVPIALALTLVLVLWTGKTLISGEWPSFVRLSSIATSYALGGIWLHIMVTRYESGMARFYRRAYPIAALLILAFEAWALVVQLGRTGLKDTEYFFLLIWVVAVVAVVLLLVRKDKAHPVIAALICAVALFAVLPGVGYHVLPVRAQVNRLENLLMQENILVDGELIPAAVEPERSVRESITDAVSFLAYRQTNLLPDWFDENLDRGDTFEAKFGFAQTWPVPDYEEPSPTTNLGTYLNLPNGSIEIQDYDWLVFMNEIDEGMDGRSSVVLNGQKGTYLVAWDRMYKTDIPLLTVEKDGELLLEEDMQTFLDGIEKKFPPSADRLSGGSVDDLSFIVETQELEILMVFRNVDINVNVRDDEIYTWLELYVLCVREK